jgi:hypothetical protein
MRAERHARPTLFDEDTDAAVDSVADHAGDVFMESALAAVRAQARRNSTLTAFDCRHRCPDCDVYDARAWGKVMRRAAQLGYVRSTETYKPGPAECHGRPLLVWRSLIVEYDDGTSFDLRKRPDAPRRPTS